MVTVSHRLEPGNWREHRICRGHLIYGKSSQATLRLKKCSTLATQVLALEYGKDIMVVKTESCYFKLY